MNDVKKRRYEKKYLIIGSLLYVIPPAVLFAFFGNEPITGLAEKVAWLTPLFILAGVLLLIIGLRPTISLNTKSKGTVLETQNKWFEKITLKSLVYLLLFLSLTTFLFVSYSTEPLKSNFFLASLVILVVGFILAMTNNWLKILEEKNLPSEFRERDEREKLITGLAARKVYIISQNLLFIGDMTFFYLAISFPQIRISLWVLVAVFFLMYVFNNLVFLFYTRKKYDPTPLNPYPPEQIKK